MTSFLSGEGILFAFTSFFAARSESACALPRPSAMASAKFAKIQVNYSITEIVSVYPAEASRKPKKEIIHSPVVSIAEI